MLSSFRLAPILTTLVVIYIIVGSSAIAFHDDDNYETDEETDPNIVTFESVCYCALVPSTITHLICTLIVLYSVPHVELVSSSTKILFGLLITSFLDIALRYLAWGFLNIPVEETGPISILFFLYLLLILLFPNVYSPYFNIREKYILGTIISIMAIKSVVASLIPIACGFITYFLFSPIYCPSNAESEHSKQD